MSSAASTPLSGLVAGLVVLGAGVAALFDGIVFHQLLQWHHMLSGWHRPDTVHNLELNTAADGWFHVAAAAIMAFGALLAARAQPPARPPARLVAGAVLLGFGGFNVAEGMSTTSRSASTMSVRARTPPPTTWAFSAFPRSSR